MALTATDIRPLELATNAIVTAKDSLLQIAFAGGIFAIMSQLIVYIARASGSTAMVGFGDMASAFCMFLATVAVSIVTMAKVLGIETPYLPSALINEKPFWKYVWASVVVSFLPVAAAVVVAGVGHSVIVGVVGKLGSFMAPQYLGLFAFALICWSVVYLRLFLVLPAVLSGEKTSPSASWKRTSGIAMKLSLAIGLAVGAFVAAEFVLNAAAKFYGDPASGVLMNILATASKLFRCAVEGALAGSVFALLQGKQDVTEEAGIADEII